MSDIAKVQLKKKWGTMQKVLSSLDRLEQIVNDVLIDMETRPRLMDGRGNAMLVCSSIYQACKIFELFSSTDLKEKCAIITSYQPSPADIKGEESGEGYTEKLRQYEIYRKMLADFFDEPEETAMYKVEEFESKVKKQFKEEPGQMRLLIVVDKLLTGFDAPSATYLYIDKPMQDHGLFQAICRVNRLDGEDKEYGYIIDYKDLFNSLEGAINDYTSGAFDNYDKEDIVDLLTNRLDRAKERLDEAREKIKALCEAVEIPRNTVDYLHYFCAKDTSDKNALKENEQKRIAFYKAANSLVRAYANLANEIDDADYSPDEINDIKKEVAHYEKAHEEIKLASGDYVDMKMYEPAMRYLLDTYIRAEDSEIVADFEELGLIELIVQNGIDALDKLPESIHKNEEAMAEVIENNIRKVIVDESPVNPKYYENMSELLEGLIEERRKQAIEYKKYLEKIVALAKNVSPGNKPNPDSYPETINTPEKKSLYDNLGNNEDLVNRIDLAIHYNKEDEWIDNTLKERKMMNAIKEELNDSELSINEIMDLVKAQNAYK